MYNGKENVHEFRESWGIREYFDTVLQELAVLFIGFNGLFQLASFTVKVENGFTIAPLSYSYIVLTIPVNWQTLNENLELWHTAMLLILYTVIHSVHS